MQNAFEDLDKKESDAKRNQGKKHRFYKELPGNLDSPCSNDFPHADLFSPFLGAGSREVDIIDAGDDQDEDCDHREDTDKFHADLTPVFRIQMDIAERLK